MGAAPSAAYERREWERYMRAAGYFVHTVLSSSFVHKVVDKKWADQETQEPAMDACVFVDCGAVERRRSAR
eukprot:6210141-Pleurochrysis_carterae.AAC.2